jgi:outer membrane immunogenic protein
LLGVAAALTAANPSQAAEGPRTPSELYVGINAGYGFGLWQTNSNEPIFSGETTSEWPKVHGPLGGMQAGFNVQPMRNFVLGLEGDIDIAHERAIVSWTDTIPLRPGGPATFTHEWDMNWFGTGRVRAGFTPSRRFLIYGTGGLAFGKPKYTFNFVQPGAVAILPPTPGAFTLTSDSGIRLGYAVGTGLEAKIDRYWSARAELLYLDFGNIKVNTLDIDGAPFKVDYHIRHLIGRVGLNCAFW